MTEEQLGLAIAKYVLPNLISPMAVGAVGWWIKGQLAKVEQIGNILLEIKHIKIKQDEIKKEIKDMNEYKEQLILMKAEMKTQWSKIDFIMKQRDL